MFSEFCYENCQIWIPSEFDPNTKYSDSILWQYDSDTIRTRTNTDIKSNMFSLFAPIDVCSKSSISSYRQQNSIFYSFSRVMTPPRSTCRIYTTALITRNSGKSKESSRTITRLAFAAWTEVRIFIEPSLGAF